ncbi:MAG: cation transporter [Candidatus Zixiibacteriota bacterium]
MRKPAKTIILVIAVLFAFSAAAFACDEKCKTDQTAKTTEASAKMVSSKTAKSGGCPLAGSPLCGGADKAAAQTATADGMVTRTISIKGMTCTGCENSISAALVKVPGVVEVVSISYQKGEAVVKVDPAKIKESEITTAVASEGYEAKIIPAVATSTGVNSTCGLSVKNAMDNAACDSATHTTTEEKKPEETK